MQVDLFHCHKSSCCDPDLFWLAEGAFFFNNSWRIVGRDEPSYPGSSFPTVLCNYLLSFIVDKEDGSLKSLSFLKIEGMEKGDSSKVDVINLKSVPLISEWKLRFTDSSSNNINDVVVIEFSLFVWLIFLQSVCMSDHYICIWFGFPHIDKG